MDRHGSPGLGPRHDVSARVQKSEGTADKLAALKARVAAAIGGAQAKGGLSVGLHPALADVGTGAWKPQNKANDSKQSKSRRHDGPKSAAAPAKQKQLDLSGPSAEEVRNNPYYDPNIAQGAKPRQARHLIFNEKGKYIQQAAALRRQAQLEALKKKIAATTRKTGIDEDADVEKNFLVEPPPDIEWFDEGLVDGKDYSHIEEPRALKIDTSDSIITSYIQHPVQIEPPGVVPALKPMYLTKVEQKKVRRNRRTAELKETQAKQRLGLIPAAMPKVKKSNMMRVIGESAIADPTAVEARVNREIAERLDTHVQQNEERKLSKDEKHDKLAKNQEADAQKGLQMLVFKINSLANGKHRYKISISAQQHALTGLAIMHPKFNLVIVEGGSWSISKYRKLMLNRVDWATNAPSRDQEKNEALKDFQMAENEKGELKDLSSNRCVLVFEGEIKTRAFKKFGSRVCETDSEARDALSRSKLDSFWNLAKSTA
ncbi:pre-mRNA processing factor 3-domain-containing protein [Xylariales sp. AK1849]|nr:pre-mRNA processing factor 3-domain-containing protein [Xylariales sp. AK1849]